MIDVLGKVGTSLAIPHNAILQIPFGHFTPFGQDIKSLDFWSWVDHYSPDRGFG
jgi:hypothetical protein